MTYATARTAADTIGNRASVGLWVGLGLLVALVLIAGILSQPRRPH